MRFAFAPPLPGYVAPAATPPNRAATRRTKAWNTNAELIRTDTRRTLTVTAAATFNR